jgi:hypothetical protein
VVSSTLPNFKTHYTAILFRSFSSFNIPESNCVTNRIRHQLSTWYGIKLRYQEDTTSNCYQQDTAPELSTWYGIKLCYQEDTASNFVINRIRHQTVLSTGYGIKLTGYANLILDFGAKDNSRDAVHIYSMCIRHRAESSVQIGTDCNISGSSATVQFNRSGIAADFHAWGIRFESSSSKQVFSALSSFDHIPSGGRQFSTLDRSREPLPPQFLLHRTS